MAKQFGITLLVSLLMFGATGCTSKDVENDDGDTAEASADAGSDDTAAADDGQGLDGKATTGDAATNDSDIVTDLDGGDKAADAPAAAGDVSDAPPATNAASDEFADMDGDVSTASNDTAPVAADQPPTDVTPVDDGKAMNSPPPIADSTSAPIPPPQDDASAPVAPPSDEAPAAPRPTGSLKKVVDAPFERGGVLLNAVYLARSGDTYKSLSTKVYGSAAKAKEIQKVNPFLGKKLKVGDKVYYNSPQRPTDNTKMLTLYEDLGMEPEIYMAKAGDNIHAVAKNLLGNKDSWKELWATNAGVESKGEMTEGTQLRYWASSDVAAPALAKNSPPPAEPQVDELAASPPPPPPPPPAQQGMTPPGDPNQQAGMAAGTMEPPPPPPPMPEPPPPPPPAMAAPKPHVAAASEDATDPLYLGAGAALVLAAVGMYIMIRKKRSRRQLDFNTSTQTQIE